MTTDYSKTVNLPKTNFPQKGDLAKREPAMLEFWDKSRIYEKMLAEGRDGSYVLHDGPPYANGNIHIGHALNKILKDLVVKTHALMGKRSPYLPGWDCHGLPIETALLKELKMGKRDVKDVPAFRQKAQEFAEKFIGIQRSEFKRLLILGEWEHPYVTMSPKYEAGIVHALHRLLVDGHIYRDLKPVYWCVYCETALAEAEVEYKDKTSPSVYVALPVRKIDDSRETNNGLNESPWKDASVLVWTTTPWTLPANMAVAFHPDLKYVLVNVRGKFGAKNLLVAEARLPTVLKDLEAVHDPVSLTLTGKEIIERKLVAEAPYGNRDSIGVLADYVTAEDGTGVVHTAPGHGEDDFHTGKKYGIEIFTPIDGSGRFTDKVPQFLGKRIFEEGNPAVIEDLKSRGWLLSQGKLQHSYPHCWRCKNPIAFRATEQWFLSIQNLRQKLLDAIAQVQWVPAEGRTRISSMVENRPDWCISRQRVWGTPIVVLFCEKCGKPSSSWPKEKLGAFMTAVEKRVAQEGTNFWFAKMGEPVDASTWDILKGVSCACGGTKFRRETDILDVWVDSGSSWLSAMEGQQSDMYLEGSDQHRGWFMSSLVISVALTGKPPYRTVLTHGFVLDDKGRAMHKSLGNVVSPQEVIAKDGADVLRMWVALADYSDDVRLSEKLLAVPADAYRKVRNTIRYLLGNLYDFDPAKDAVPLERLGEMDRYILHRFDAVAAETVKAYEEFRYRDAARALTDFCNLDLSKFYLDANKDKLYTVAHSAPEVRSAQTAMYSVLRSLLLLVAPILSFTAEEAWAELRRVLGEELKSSEKLPESVFLARFPSALGAKLGWTSELDARWRDIFDVRQRVLKALEEKREARAIGSGLEARVKLKGKADLLEPYKSRWPEILNVSQVEIVPNGNELSIEVSKAEGAKCARCWRYQTDVNADGLCSRCVRQLQA